MSPEAALISIAENLTAVTGATGPAGPSNMITESGGPANLSVGAVADGQALQRSGTTIVGITLALYSGTGSPETVITAPVGSLYRRTDGGAATTLYVKESGSGNTGWIGK